MTDIGVLRYRLEGSIPCGRYGEYIRKQQAAFLKRLKRDRLVVFKADDDGWQYCMGGAMVKAKRQPRPCPRCGYRRGDA